MPTEISLIYFLNHACFSGHFFQVMLVSHFLPQCSSFDCFRREHDLGISGAGFLQAG